MLSSEVRPLKSGFYTPAAPVVRHEFRLPACILVYYSLVPVLKINYFVFLSYVAFHASSTYFCATALKLCNNTNTSCYDDLFTCSGIAINLTTVVPNIIWFGPGLVPIAPTFRVPTCTVIYLQFIYRRCVSDVDYIASNKG